MSRKLMNARKAIGPSHAVDKNISEVGTHAIQFQITGAPTAVTLVVEGNINDADWDKIAVHIATVEQLANGHGMFHVINKPVENVRLNLAVLEGGTAPTVSAWYEGI
jgi:hypothetical protein